jgi:TRAP-type transport system periplasmic protein
MTSFKAAVLSLALALPARAGEAKFVKFACLAPDGSTWMKAINELNKDLDAATKGELKLKIYAGGVQGDEKDVVRKIKIGQLHAAGFTGVGIGEIAPELRILDAPWLFNNYEEVDHVYKKFDGEFRQIIDKAGFVLLGWTELGFVYVFSKNPINSPDDMKKQKMWVWEGDPIAQAAYKAIGVSPIPLSVVDVMSSLQTGLIDGVYGPPLAVSVMQWFTRTKYIYATPMADSSGAVLVSKASFEKLTAEQKKALLDASDKHLKKLNAATRKENIEALEALKKQGLTLSAAPSKETLERYKQLGTQARAELAGKLYSKDLLDRVEKALAEFRAGGVKPKK